MNLKIYGRRNSLNVQKVMWLVGELALPHEHIAVGGTYGGLDSPDFLAMNPHGRIPLLVDDTTVVWESHAILRYLAARYGAPQFWSENASQRAHIDQWMDWSQTTLQPEFLNGIFWVFYRTPEQERNWPQIEKSVNQVTQYFLLLDKILNHKAFLCGPTLSLADITVGSMLYRYFELDIKRPTIHNVEAWYLQLQERTPYREHVMVPFSDMKGRLTF